MDATLSSRHIEWLYSQRVPAARLMPKTKTASSMRHIVCVGSKRAPCVVHRVDTRSF